MARAGQYTTHQDSDLYRSAITDDELNSEERNPFKQANPTAAADPDLAAPAAINAAEDAASPPPPPPLPQIDDCKTRRTSQSKRPRSPSLSQAQPQPPTSSLSIHALSDTLSAFEEDMDRPGAEPQVKRARHDDGSRSLLVQPGDDEQAEDEKMRANLLQRGVLLFPDDTEGVHDGPEGVDGDGDDGDADDDNRDEDGVDGLFTGSKEVRPVPLMDKLAQEDKAKTGKSVLGEGDVGDDYFDVEAKRGDDYDPENYEEFEDDQDDMGEVEAELDADGSERMDERFMIQEDDLVPSATEEREDTDSPQVGSRHVDVRWEA